MKQGVAMQQRQTTTKSAIKEAFIQLLATKSFEEISISQLTKKAGVNRSTFYLHYLDKQDFLEQLKEETLDTIRDIFRQECHNPKKALEEVLSYFYESKSFFLEIAKNPSFCFSDNIRSFLMSMLESTPGSRYLISRAYQLPERYAVTMYISGLTGLIVDWIINEAQESPQQLTKIILDSPGMEWFKEKEI
ncbi:Transcriptional regulator, TetR family [Streptococcus sp. DD13]|nr:Transcriptional regulator, TetR family [Streptococcus sp. DD13]